MILNCIFLCRSTVKCIFHHIDSNDVKLINSSFGISTKLNRNKTELSCSCSLSKADEIRSTLSNLIGQNRQIWFSITYPKDNKLPFIQFGKNIGNEIHISFGSLLSTSKFIVHDTSLKDDANQWTTMFCNDGKTLIIKCILLNKIISLTLPMEYIDKTVLVIDDDTYSNIILNIKTITADIRINDKRYFERYNLKKIYLIYIYIYLDYMVLIHLLNHLIYVVIFSFVFHQNLMLINFLIIFV